jgi:hypothetical protein
MVLLGPEGSPMPASWYRSPPLLLLRRRCRDLPSLRKSGVGQESHQARPVSVKNSHQSKSSVSQDRHARLVPKSAMVAGPRPSRRGRVKLVSVKKVIKPSLCLSRTASRASQVSIKTGIQDQNGNRRGSTRRMAGREVCRPRGMPGVGQERHQAEPVSVRDRHQSKSGVIQDRHRNRSQEGASRTEEREVSSVAWSQIPGWSASWEGRPHAEMMVSRWTEVHTGCVSRPGDGVRSLEARKRSVGKARRA